MEILRYTNSLSGSQEASLKTLDSTGAKPAYLFKENLLTLIICWSFLRSVGYDDASVFFFVFLGISPMYLSFMWTLYGNARTVVDTIWILLASA